MIVGYNSCFLFSLFVYEFRDKKDKQNKSMNKNLGNKAKQEQIQDIKVEKNEMN